MAKLIYSTLMSLDAFIADAQGNFDWAEPDGEVHAFINDQFRDCSTHLYGRRMYEVMRVWDSDEMMRGMPDYIQDFAGIWRAAAKVVYSRTLENTTTSRTRLERQFDAGAVERLKETAPGNLAIAGPTLAAHAFSTGLVDECHMFVAPIAVGGGVAAFPVGSSVKLGLTEQRRFSNGMVYLRYSVCP